MADNSDSTDYNESDRCWSMMTVSYGGTMSLLRDMDAPTARAVYRSLQPWDHPTRYVGEPDPGDPDFPYGFSYSAYGRTIKDGDITKIEIIGPDGANLDPWRGVEAKVVDVSNEVARQRAWARRVAADKAASLKETIAPLPEARKPLLDRIFG